MSLPHVDLELMYWRARRRTQRLQCAARDLQARMRSELQLRVLLLSMQLRAASPEETFAYRAMWAIALAGFVLVLAVEAIGEAKFFALVQTFFRRNA